jgi:scyllo-inositol 2-dehydrogenase (NADP+)
MKALRVGLVGYGYVGANFHAPIIGAVPGLRLTKISSSRPDIVRAALPDVEVTATPSALFADPDIDLVVITSPNDSHAPLAQQALEADKHVVVEKPFVIRSLDGQALAELARQRDRVLSVFHNRRWDGDFLTVKKLISDGTLGEIVTFESHFDRFRPQVRDRWRESAAAGGGLLFDLGPHLIDQTIQLFGMPDTVYADLQRQRDGGRAVDYVHLVLGYGRMRAILHAASLVRVPSPRFVVQGKNASFVKYGLDTQEPALLRGERPGHPQWGQDDASQYGKLIVDGDERVVETQLGCYENYYSMLADAIHGTGPIPVMAQDGVTSIRIIEAALVSEREGRVVRLS